MSGILLSRGTSSFIQLRITCYLPNNNKVVSGEYYDNGECTEGSVANYITVGKGCMFKMTIKQSLVQTYGKLR